MHNANEQTELHTTIRLLLRNVADGRERNAFAILLPTHSGNSSSRAAKLCAHVLRPHVQTHGCMQYNYPLAVGTRL